MMDVAFEQEVRERAYHIWQAAGMDEGSADLHWFSAEQAVICEVKKAPKKPAAAKAARSGTAKVISTAAKAPRSKAVAKNARAEASSPSLA